MKGRHKVAIIRRHCAAIANKGSAHHTLLYTLLYRRRLSQLADIRVQGGTNSCSQGHPPLYLLQQSDQINTHAPSTLLRSGQQQRDRA